MSDIIKQYSNGDVTIVWQPQNCIHSTICWRGENALPQVFNPKVRPWIQPENADTALLIKHVKQCPSGALSILETSTHEVKVEFVDNGPVKVTGSFCVNYKNNEQIYEGVAVFL